MTPISRRRLLASAGIGIGGVGVGVAGYLVGQDSAEASGEGTGSVPSRSFAGRLRRRDAALLSYSDSSVGIC
jgi:hypothetical protein